MNDFKDPVETLRMSVKSSIINLRSSIIWIFLLLMFTHTLIIYSITSMLIFIGAAVLSTKMNKDDDLKYKSGSQLLEESFKIRVITVMASAIGLGVIVYGHLNSNNVSIYEVGYVILMLLIIGSQHMMYKKDNEMANHPI